ncbi:MAG: diacylglycerol kinase family protein [Bacteroidota bacterium]
MIKWYFIVNPAAGSGKTAHRWQQYLPRLQAAFPAMEWVSTTHAGAASQLALAAIQRGYRNIIAVGGDGTNFEVINGIFLSAYAEEVTYCLLPVGSGNDWAKTHRIPRRLAAWINMIKANDIRYQRIGIIQYFLEGKPQQRFFANVAGLAYDAYVVRRSEQAQFKNRLIYPLLTLLYLKDYQPQRIRLQYDGHGEITNRFYTINVGIGKYSGGGMRLVPQAQPNGNTFALTYAKHLSIWSILWHSWRFYHGSIGQVKQVTTTFAKVIHITAEPSNQVSVEADGEWLGYGPVTFNLHPVRLRLVGNV